MAGKDEAGRPHSNPKARAQTRHRRERLAAALRENLRRRKRQARERAEQSAPSPKDDRA